MANGTSLPMKTKSIKLLMDQLHLAIVIGLITDHTPLEMFMTLPEMVTLGLSLAGTITVETSRK